MGRDQFRALIDREAPRGQIIATEAATEVDMTWESNYPIEAGGTVYYLDLFHKDLMLCIEIDGSSHNRPLNKLRDDRRDRNLNAIGIRTVRMTNHTDRAKYYKDIRDLMEKRRKAIEWRMDHAND